VVLIIDFLYYLCFNLSITLMRKGSFMKKLSLVVSAMIVASAIVIGVVGTAGAQSINDQKCELYARSYSVGETTITANFFVKSIDNTNCNKVVTVAAWNAPNGVDGVPFEAQTLEDYKTGTFAPGFHALIVKKPKCFYQVDLLRGANPYGATPGRPDYTAAQYVSSAHGGQECKPTPTPQPTPVTPAGQGGPEVLPKTGPIAMIPLAVAGGSIASLAHNLRARRRIQK
jgi:hypothetical protein